MLNRQTISNRASALLRQWVTPQSPNTADHFQERNIRVIVLVGTIVFILIFLMSLLRGSAFDQEEFLFFAFSVGLAAMVGGLVHFGHVQLSSQAASFGVLLILIDPTVAYWSPGTVLFGILFSFGFLLITPTSSKLALPVALNMIIYVVLALLDSRKSPLSPGDFYSDPFSAIITTLIGHFLILSIGFYIRYDQSYKDTFILKSEQERAEILRRFISNTSHDLRTPLTSIKVSAYLLGKMATERQESRLSILEADIQRLEAVLSAMLEISRFDAGVDFEPKERDLSTLLREIIENYEAHIEEKSQTLTFVPAANSIIICVDTTYIRRAVGGIIENAIHFTPTEGTILIRTYQKGRQVYIEIQDSGSGILPEDLPYIFDGFYRADRARTSSTGKTGLGLAIAKRAVEKHNGRIEVQSVVGEGSTFSIILPM